MGLFKKLKKIVHKARVGLGLPALTVGNAVKLGVATAIPGGTLGALAGSVLKSKLRSVGVGGAKRVLRGKAERALVTRFAMAPMANGVASSQAVARPGGSPVRTIGFQGSKRRAGGAAAARSATLKRATGSRRRKSQRAKSSKPRRAPTGGLNLKALSASWRAAGKPGKWIDYVKANSGKR